MLPTTSAGGDIAPAGQRVVLEARGDIWSVPVKNGSPRNMTRTSGVAERDPSWSPDGKWIAYFADITGEYELYIKQSDGKGETRRLTEDGEAYRYAPAWSGDSKHIVFTDKTGTIYLHTIDERQDPQDRPGLACRPTHHQLVARQQLDRLRQDQRRQGGHLLDLALRSQPAASRTQVTDDMFNDSSPTFDRKGEYLYFASNRHFGSPMYEDLGTTFIYGKTEILIAMPLRKDVKNPLLPKSDEVPIEQDKKEEKQEPAEIRRRAEGRGAGAKGRKTARQRKRRTSRKRRTARSRTSRKRRTKNRPSRTSRRKRRTRNRRATSRPGPPKRCRQERGRTKKEGGPRRCRSTWRESCCARSSIPVPNGIFSSSA